MKVLVTTTLSPNQLRAHLLPIANVPEVEEIVLVTDEQPPPLPKLTAQVPPARERRVLGRAAAKLVRSARVARRLRPAWVISYNIMPHAINGLVAGRVSGARTMYHMIGGETEWRGGGWRSENAILGRLPRPVGPLESGLVEVMRQTDVVCTLGTRARAQLLAAGLDPQRVLVAPPAIDTDRFAPAPVNDDRPYALLTVGRLVPAKRLHDFIAVVRKLRERRRSLRAAIAGTGPLERELRDAAARAGVADAIDFLGLVPEIETVYRSAQVFVLTSEFEGLSVALGEAAASGLPTVVTDVGDLPDLVVDGESGFVRPVGDIAGMTTAVDDLLSNKRLYGAAAKAARAAALERRIAVATALYRTMLVKA